MRARGCGLLEALQHGVGAVGDAARHAGEACHVDAEAVFRAAAGEFAQEHYFSVDFAHAYVVVGDACEPGFHVVEFVVVCGEQRVHASVLVDVFDDGPCYGYAVVGACASAEFVEKDERAWAHVVEYARGLVHFHHEGAFAEGNVVAGSDAGEHLVDHADACGVGGHEAAALGHDDVERRLAQQGRFAAHVGAGDHHYLRGVVVELEAVGYVRFAGGQLALDDGVACLGEAECERVVDCRAAVASFGGRAGESEQHVEAGEHGGVELQRGDVGSGVGHEARVEACLYGFYAFLGREDFMLVFFQLGCDVAFGVDECLLSNPFGGHFVAVCVGDFDVVAEHVVVAYFQGADACGFALACLYAQQVVFASA